MREATASRDESQRREVRVTTTLGIRGMGPKGLVDRPLKNESCHTAPEKAYRNALGDEERSWVLGETAIEVTLTTARRGKGSLLPPYSF